MNVADHRQRFREASPLSAVKHRGGATPTASEDDVSIASVGVEPNEVVPGGTVSVKVLTTENVWTMGGENQCPPDTYRTDAGYSIEVNVTAQWGGTSRATDCIPVFTAGSGQVETNVDLLVPSEVTPGQYNIDVSVEAGNTGDHLGTGSTTITVSQSGAGGQQCQRERDCPDGYTCVEGVCTFDNTNGNGGGGPWLPCFIDPNHSCGQTEFAAYIAALTLFLVVVVSSR